MTKLICLIFGHKPVKTEIIESKHPALGGHNQLWRIAFIWTHTSCGRCKKFISYE